MRVRATNAGGWAAAGLMCLAAALGAWSQPFPGSALAGMRWRLIGPFRGGRVNAVTGIAGNAKVFYFGAVAGGVWKTTNGGLSWTPLFQHQPVSSIGSLAVAPSDSNVIYVGTGDACIRPESSFGDGVYKSVDGGRTWSNTGLQDTRHIGKVIVDPRDPSIVFVAALGHEYGPNAERGIFRSIDGGGSWQKVLFVDDKTGAIDVTFDPNNSHILFAAFWQVYRTPYSLESGGPGSGIYKSIDGGTNWKRLEARGLPEGILGRIGVAVSGADSSRVYAMIEAEKGGLYRSDDGGASWKLMSDDHRLRQRPWYFTHVVADPRSAETVYVLNTGVFRSTDGGKSFDEIPAPHGDNHGLWIDPTDPGRMIVGNDGGASISEDGGKGWSTEYNQPTGQFYHVAVDNRFNFYLYGSQQDNTTVAIPSRSDLGFIDRSDWYPVGGGESGWVAPYPPDPDIVYASAFYSHGGSPVSRWSKHTGQAQDVSPWPISPMGGGADDSEHRFQWTAPLIVSPNDPNELYFGGEVLFRTTNGGQSWQIISPDLTRNDKSKQKSSGGPISQDNTSAEYYDTIFAIAESPVKKDLLWVGSDDGLVHMSPDGGKHWEDVTPKQIPAWSLVSGIEPSPHDAATAYVVFDRHKLEDGKPYIFKTGDYGKTWQDISGGLPQEVWARAVREDPGRAGLLYAGTETGVWASFDGGGHWQSLQLNLPTTSVRDLAVKNGTLVIATFGRGFWALDDLSPLRQMNAAVVDSDAHLFHPAPAYRINQNVFFIPEGLPAGQNPPSGAILYYWLKSAAKGEATLEILDSAGKLVRKFSNHPLAPREAPGEFPGTDRTHIPIPTQAGLDRFVWDLRATPPTTVPGAVFLAGRPIGPLVVPGAYQVRLTVDGKAYSEPVEVKLDPRVKAGQENLEKQYQLALSISHEVSQAHDALNQMRDLRRQVEFLHSHLGNNAKSGDVRSAGEKLEAEIGEIEGALIQTKAKAYEDVIKFRIQLTDKLMNLEIAVESADAAPTAQEYTAFDLLKGQLDASLARWHEVETSEVPAFNRLAGVRGIPLVAVRPAEEILSEESQPKAPAGSDRKR
ncbi:MAG TPA: hypothetical protein VGS20_04340 [Candidatus Acidoferrales bacterium]|nr:hypothetical protein [Candidatus Acidoferrales bacterium]